MPKIQLTEEVQEHIAEMQADNCAQPKMIIKTLDSWITTILTGNDIVPSDPEEVLKFLAELNSIKIDYQSFIVDTNSL